MTREHRRDFENAFHHVMNRAGARRKAFVNSKHDQAFLEAIERVVKRDGIEVHAYCLMGNHFHLLVRTPHANLREAMQRLGIIFTRRFNRIENVDGPFRSLKLKISLVK